MDEEIVARFTSSNCAMNVTFTSVGVYWTKTTVPEMVCTVYWFFYKTTVKEP